jgi:hypothetical protein
MGEGEREEKHSSGSAGQSDHETASGVRFWGSSFGRGG